VELYHLTKLLFRVLMTTEKTQDTPKKSPSDLYVVDNQKESEGINTCDEIQNWLRVLHLLKIAAFTLG